MSTGSGSSGDLSEFSKNRYFVNSVEARPNSSFVVISYGDGDVRNIRSLDNIRHNIRDEEVTQSDVAVIYQSVKKVSEHFRDRVSVIGGHDCFNHFSSGSCVITGGKGGLFWVNNRISYTSRNLRDTNIGHVYEYQVSGVNKKGRIPQGEYRADIDQAVWLLGSGLPSLFESEGLKDPTPVMAIRVGPGGTWVYAWEQGFVYLDGMTYVMSGPGSFCGRVHCANGRSGPAKCPLCLRLPTARYSAIYTTTHETAFIVGPWVEFENFPRAEKLSCVNKSARNPKRPVKLTSREKELAKRFLCFGGNRVPPPDAKPVRWVVDFYLTLRVVYKVDGEFWVGSPVISPPLSLYLYYLQLAIGIKWLCI